MAAREHYTHGHHESVLRSHSWRTIANSAAYLSPHLTPGLRVLDVGCGPGTITAELADRVGLDGSVLGVDASADVVALASDAQRRPNLTFAVGDVYAIDAADGTYATVEELGRMADAWRAWASDPDAWFTVIHGEILSRS